MTLKSARKTRDGIDYNGIEIIETADQEIERLHKQDGKGTAPPYFMSEAGL